MHVSPAGLAFIANEEGCVLHPYPDSRHFATIFVGHLIAERPPVASDATHFSPLTREHAIQVLHTDVSEKAEAPVSAHVHVPLNQNEFDALCSLVFNIGPGAFAGSTVLRKLNAGDRQGAADAFLMWHVGGAGLLGRRQRERAIFLKPAARPKPAPKTKDPLAVLTDEEHKIVSEYDRLKKARRGAPRRKVLLSQMVIQRKRIFVAAGKGGWDRNNRRARYHLLLDRTR